jgi:hypothetical protein
MPMAPAPTPAWLKDLTTYLVTTTFGPTVAISVPVENQGIASITRRESAEVG